MFKNLTLFKAKRSNAPMASNDELEGLHARQFQPCQPTARKSIGWVPPREQHGLLVESIGGHLILKCMLETKSVPASELDKRVDDLADKHFEQTGRKVGRKLRRELREQAELDLLPQAFPKQTEVLVWMDPAAGTLAMDTSSSSKAGDVATLLVGTFDGLEIVNVNLAQHPASVLSAWLADGQAGSENLSLGREATMESADDMKSLVRYSRKTLDCDELKEHVRSGMVAKKVALEWQGRIGFTLTAATLAMSKLVFADLVFDGGRDAEVDAFDADVTIATGELRRMLADLLDALGGEQEAAA